MRCDTCHGRQTVPADGGDTKSAAARVVCPDCGGTGHSGAGYGERDVQYPEQRRESWPRK